MTRDIGIMKNIQEQKMLDIEKHGLKPLDDEGRAVAEHKRFTLDMVGTPVDPLR